MTEARPSGGLGSKLRELFGIDGRSLALYRIGLGIMLLSDLFKRSLTFRAHYGEEGVFPRQLAVDTMGSSFFNVFLLTDSLLFTGLLFVVMGVLALAVTLGYRTRLATVLFVVLLTSLNRRNIWVLHTGDVFLFCNVLWACFLPLGNTFSIDRLRRRSRGEEPDGGRARQCLSVGTVGLLVQLSLFYFAAGVLKLYYDVWTRGEAMWVFARIEEYTRPFASVLGDMEGTARVLTYFTLVLECGGPLLLFCPWFTPQIRTVLTFVFMGFHLGIQLAVYIGIFELVSMVAVTVFLPAWFWDAVLPRLPVFGGLRRTWQSARLRLARRFPDRPSAETEGAWARACRRFQLASQGLAGVFLVIVIVTNAYSIKRRPIPEFLERDTIRDLALIQNWSIFSNIEPLFRGWFLVIGQQEDGRLVDVLQDAPFLGPRKPEHFAASFPNHNMRRFWVNMNKRSNAWLRPYLADYLRRRWNAEHDRKIGRLLIVHVGKAGKEEVDQLVPLIAFDPDQFAASRGTPIPPETPRRAALRQHWEQLLGSFAR